MTYESLRRPFIIRLRHGHRRIIAIERHDGFTHLITDQGGAINHTFLMQMIRNGEATFDIDQPPEPIRIKFSVDKSTLQRVNELFRLVKERLNLNGGNQ